MDCGCGDPECSVVAEQKARRLLHSHLNSYQRKLLDKYGYISVRGGVTGDKYHIHGNIYSWVTRVRDQRGYCLEVLDDGDAHATPIPDRMLAKKILLEADEMLFLKTAIASGGDD